MSFCSKMVYSLFLLWLVQRDNGVWSMDAESMPRKRFLSWLSVAAGSSCKGSELFGATDHKVDTSVTKKPLSVAERERREKALAAKLLLHTRTTGSKGVDPTTWLALQQALQKASPDKQRGYSIHPDKAEQAGVGSLQVPGPPPVCFIQTLHYTSEKPSR